MTTSKIRIVYWDTCIFLAYINREKRPTWEVEGLKKLVNELYNNEYLMITSALTRAEILITSSNDFAPKKFDEILEWKSVFPPMPTDDKIWLLTQELRTYYKEKGDEQRELRKAGKKVTVKPTLSIPDAVHLATAIIGKADIFYTFDKKSNKKGIALVPLSKKIMDGKYQLSIESPSTKIGRFYMKPLIKDDEWPPYV